MPSRVPIALVLSSFEPGSTERQTIELVRRLDRDRFDVHLACFRRRGAWLAQAEAHAATIAEFPIAGLRKPSTLTVARRFARWCRERDIALVHTADADANVFGLPAAALAGVPVRIGSRHERDAERGPAQIALQRAAYACAHLVVAGSRAAADRLSTARVPARCIRVVAAGVDPDAYHPRTHDRPLRRIVTVAPLTRGQGHDLLIDAAALLLKRCPDAEFLFAGDGPRRADLEALARVRGIAGRIRFLGSCEDVPRLLSEADLFVLPSRSEAFPTVVLEAMAAGLPVVATRAGSMAEVVDHQRTGVLVPPGDGRALGFALLDLVQWRDHARGLGRAARRAVETRYSCRRMVEQFERIYGEQLTARAPMSVATSEMMAS